MKRQLEFFYQSLAKTFFDGAPLNAASNWFLAFRFLHEQIDKSKRLRDLSAAGFIEPASSWEKKQGKFYRVIDEFSLFYLKWVARDSRRKEVPQY
jgi:hypothetical protein